MDSAAAPPPMLDGLGEPALAALERDHVHQVYDHIAEHFSETRYKPWPVVRKFLDDMEPGAVVADVGCGNGKYMGVNPNVLMLGSDRSSKLADIASRRGHHVVVADNLSLPYRDGAFDHVISIAVLHHFTSVARRLAAVQELIRLLRPGGTGLFYVWALEQEQRTLWKATMLQKGRKFDTQDTFVPWHLQVGSSAPSGQVFQRFYHVFAEGELEQLLQMSEQVEVLTSGYDRDNWYAIARRSNA